MKVRFLALAQKHSDNDAAPLLWDYRQHLNAQGNGPFRAKHTFDFIDRDIVLRSSGTRVGFLILPSPSLRERGLLRPCPIEVTHTKASRTNVDVQLSIEHSAETPTTIDN